ncbi:MAG: cytochrome b [Pseudomonadota bacterium]
MLRNSPLSWGALSIALHWITALLVIGMIAVGVYMTKFAEPFSALQFTLYQWHKSFGMLILALAAIRLVWRLTGGDTPPLPTDIKPWERVAAHVTHYGLYALLFAMPLIGWVLVSSAPIQVPTLLFTVIPLPHLMGPNETVYLIAEWAHWLGGLGFLGLIALHAGAALKHHFVLRDNVLVRMLPRMLRPASRPSSGAV